jgi:hypothetical protein
MFHGVVRIRSAAFVEVLLIIDPIIISQVAHRIRDAYLEAL